MEQEKTGEQAHITITEVQLELMLGRAAEAGARKALHDIGLHDEDAAGDVRDLRDLLETWRDAKRTAWKTFVGWVTKGFLAMLVVGAWYQLKDK